MDTGKAIKELLTLGFTITDIEYLEDINKLKKNFSSYLGKKYGFENKNCDQTLNYIHKLAIIDADKKANDLVLDSIKYLNKDYSFGKLILNSCSNLLTNIFGLDLHVQKSNNIVFQYPNSMRYSELHTDGPVNSLYELVAWLPLVNCFSTKSFFIVPLNDSMQLLNKHKNDEFNSWEELRNEAISKSVHLEVDYGKIVFFWSGLLHGSLINKTDQSRWSLNTRFKNLFAPQGIHDNLIFYEAISKSPLTEHALNYKISKL